MFKFDKESISAAMVRKNTSVLMAPDFSFDKIRNQNQTLYTIAKWVQVMMKFYELKNYGRGDFSKLDDPGSDDSPIS